MPSLNDVTIFPLQLTSICDGESYVIWSIWFVVKSNNSKDKLLRLVSPVEIIKSSHEADIHRPEQKGKLFLSAKHERIKRPHFLPLLGVEF